MLARSGLASNAEGWAYKVEFDGVRAQVRLDGGRLCVRSRPGHDCTRRLPRARPLSEVLDGHRLLLDGELVCLNDEGDPDFARLRARLRSADREARLAAKRSPTTFLAQRSAPPILDPPEGSDDWLDKYPEAGRLILLVEDESVAPVVADAVGAMLALLHGPLGLHCSGRDSV